LAQRVVFSISGKICDHRTNRTLTNTNKSLDPGIGVWPLYASGSFTLLPVKSGWTTGCVRFQLHIHSLRSKLGIWISLTTGLLTSGAGSSSSRLGMLVATTGLPTSCPRYGFTKFARQSRFSAVLPDDASSGRLRQESLVWQLAEGEWLLCVVEFDIGRVHMVFLSWNVCRDNRAAKFAHVRHVVSIELLTGSLPCRILRFLKRAFATRIFLTCSLCSIDCAGFLFVYVKRYTFGWVRGWRVRIVLRGGSLRLISLCQFTGLEFKKI
jgi:hypothetical protein